MIKRALFSRANIENAKEVARDSFDFEDGHQLFTEHTTKDADLKPAETNDSEGD
jgi:hypothetical protein